MNKLHPLGWFVFSLVLIPVLGRPVAPERGSHQSRPAFSPSQVHSLKVTVLSTMLAGEGVTLGEWGFSALLEADGHRILLDTGAHPETVLQNARALQLDLAGVREVVLTHNHKDHTGGLLTLRKALMKQDPAALSLVHVARGIFYPRPGPAGEENGMIALRKEVEATGSVFIEHPEGAELFAGAWLTGPIPRKSPERNWSVTGKVQTPQGLVEDTIPEDQSLVFLTPDGLVIVTGCGHAGVINILTLARERFPDQKVDAVIGGLHLFPLSDEQLNWTADRLKPFQLGHLLGAHCTGIEAVYRIRERLGLSRQCAVVGSVGSSYVLGEGLHPGSLAK